MSTETPTPPYDVAALARQLERRYPHACRRAERATTRRQREIAHIMRLLQVQADRATPRAKP